MVTAREHRDNNAKTARDVQLSGALIGSLQTSIVGLLFTGVAHRTWPAYTRRTIQFKSFVLCGFALAGFALGAENALMKYEAEQRLHENYIRQQAQVELVSRGIMPTEAAIQHWKLEKHAATARAAALVGAGANTDGTAS